jgi:hypothetical protein
VPIAGPRNDRQEDTARASKLDWVLVGPVLPNDAPLSNH